MEKERAELGKLTKPFRYWLIIFFVGLLFTFLLWDHYFNSSNPVDRNIASHLVLLMGTLFSASAALFAWSVESGVTRLEKAVERRTEDLRKRNEELETALSEIKTLQGLLPICAWCKKIRDDQGYWQQIDTYLMDRSALKFTHGLCRQCADKAYAEYKDQKKETPS